MPAHDGGLGAALVGEKIVVNTRHLAVSKLLGEGGFSYVYLVKELADTATGGSLNATGHGGSSKATRSSSNGSGGKEKRAGSMGKDGEKREMVLKVTSILSRQQRDIAEKEAKLLSRLSHPSIIKMYDTCYRTVPGKSKRSDDSGKVKDRPQHLILMEYCEGGHALGVCTALAAKGERFDLSSLIIAFGQICNAVSYLHAQRPPIVHRDLKPENFLIKNGAYKLCDFGSAVFGHVDLKTSEARAEAEEVIQKTTTQMFRAPEMVDLFVAKKLTQATDVWALGACLYSLAFLQNCFEEGSNLAILSRKYKIPDDNPYGDGLVELLDRMLTLDSKARADMTEVILCLSAVYSGRPLPPRKEKTKKKDEKEEESTEKKKSSHSRHKKKEERVGTFRTDGQGIYDDGLGPIHDPKKPVTAKKLDPNSAAARRRKTAAGVADEFAAFENKFGEASALPEANPEAAFSATAAEAFSTTFDTKLADDKVGDAPDMFASFDVGEGSVDPGANAFKDGWAAAGTDAAETLQFNASFTGFGDGDGEIEVTSEEHEEATKRQSGDDENEESTHRRSRRTAKAEPRGTRTRRSNSDARGVRRKSRGEKSKDGEEDEDDDDVEE